jgi:NAD+ diphosphatase
LGSASGISDPDVVGGLVSGTDGAMKLGRLALARGILDRVAHRRDDTQWLARAWADPRTRVLVVADGQALVRFTAGYDGPGCAGLSLSAGGAPNVDDTAGGGGSASGGDLMGAGGCELLLLSPAEAPVGERILLGVDAAGVAFFAVLGPLPDLVPLADQAQYSGTGGNPSADKTSEPDGAPRPGHALSPGQAPGQPPSAGHAGTRVVRAGLRQVGALLGDRDAGLFTHSVALANWHGTHSHCPRCGARTRLAAAGHIRVCPRDGSEHFPRVDPAVIMLVLDSAGRCLLARNQKWPQKRVSVLAGFVEPGESVEHAVAREVREEVGISVGEFHYLGSQPWPMPQSLMLGFSARAIEDGQGHQPIRVDAEEIAEARWYGREDLLVAIEAGEIMLPPPVSIAHRIIEAWYGAPLPGSW